MMEPPAPEAVSSPADKAGGLDFRSVYLNTFTSAFGDELAKFRGSDTGRSTVRTDLLLQCIEAGMDAFSETERALCLEDARRAVGQMMTAAATTWL